MNWGSLIKALPALLGLIGGLFSNRKNPPKRASEILGKPGEPTESAEAKEKADKAAADKYDK